MQSLLLKQIWYMTRCAFYGLFLQGLLCGMLVAKEGNAQRMKLEEVKLSIDVKDVQLTEAFAQIEKEVGFNFIYEKNIANKRNKVSLFMEQQSLMYLLKHFSKEADVKFRRVNENIYVSKKKDLRIVNDDVIDQIFADVDISGKITDENGQGLPGASVVEKGTSNGTTTDLDGKYKLNVPEGTIITISFVGYETQEILLGSQSVIDVQMVMDADQLEEVVVIGYGVKEKSDITGSVSSINSKDFENQPMIRTENILKGRTAGVTVQTTSGAPGAGMKIRIRGFNSVNGDNNPLYVIDGFVGGDISILNPDDIASVDILKDASATAIYGSRGSNGVIIITTKTGKSGELKIDFNTFYTVDKISKKLDLLSTEEYMTVVNERNRDVGLGDVFSSADIESVTKTGGTDWLDEILRNGTTQNYQLALSGGNEKTKFYVSASMAGQEGIIKNSFYKRYGIRANLSSQLNKKTDVVFNMYANHTTARNNYTYQGRSTALGAAHVFPPNISVLDSQNNYTLSPVQYGPIAANPVYQVAERLFDEKKWNTWSQLQLNYEIIEGLKLSVIGGVNGIFTHTPIFKRYQPGSVESTSEASQADNFYYRLQNTNILNYSKNINNDHYIDVSAIYEQQVTKSEGNYAYSTGLTTNALTYYRLQLGANQQVSSGYSDQSLQSFLGRINYTFKDRYLFTASFRADGSSKFGDGNKYGYFPSAAFAWRTSEEDFMEGVKFLSDLKLRASIGKVGSQAISPYTTLTTLVLNENYPLNNNSMSIGIGPGNPSNPDLKWETTTQVNFGIDFGTLKGKVTGAIDLYRKRTDDLLLNVPVPAYGGGGSVLKNIGSVENKGIEFLVNWSTIDHEDFKLNTSFNLSINRNKVLDLGVDSVLYVGNFILRPGEPISQFYGFQYEGTWKGNQTAEAAEYAQVPGDPRYKDVNDDKIIGAEDLDVLGNPLPDFTWGWNTSIEYKNFDLNLLVNGAHGYQVWNITRFLILGSGDAIPTSKEILNRWTPQNNESNIPGFSNTSNSRSRSDQWIEDGSFFRVSNITLGYTMPQSIFKNSIKSARIYVSAQNLALFTNYSSYDPELSTTPLGSDTQQGVDDSTYPSLRSFTIGTKVTF